MQPIGPLLGARMTLERDVVLCGSNAGNEIELPIAGVDPHHARLHQVDDHWILEDLRSSTGTLVNDKLVERRRLAHGDQIRIGPVIMKFLATEDVEAAYHEELYWLTIRDPLTGAHNRRYLDDFLIRELAAATRHQHALSIVSIDLDHFKAINDHHGHLGGDAVLRQLGRRVMGRMRREDLFARAGGEEFICVLPRTELAGAVAFAEGVRTLIGEAPFAWDGAQIATTISAGVAELRELWPTTPPVTPSELLALADARLYDAKRAGRNLVVGGDQ